MANETSRQRNGRLALEQVRESVGVLTEYLDDELKEYSVGETVPEDHVAFHVKRLNRWLRQPHEPADPEGHCGFRNYETWLAALWMTSDESLYGYWRRGAVDASTRPAARGASRHERRSEAVSDLARCMKEELEPDSVSHFIPRHGFYRDLLLAAFAAVDWREVAAGFIDEVRK